MCLITLVKLLFPLIFRLFLLYCIVCHFILFSAAIQYCKRRYTNSFCDCDCDFTKYGLWKHIVSQTTYINITDKNGHIHAFPLNSHSTFSRARAVNKWAWHAVLFRRTFGQSKVGAVGVGLISSGVKKRSESLGRRKTTNTPFSFFSTPERFASFLTPGEINPTLPDEIGLQRSQV